MAYYTGIQQFNLWQSHLYFSWTGGQVADEMYTGYKFLWKLYKCSISMLCHITFSGRSMPIHPYPNLYQSCRRVLLAEWLFPWIGVLSNHFFFSCNRNELKGSTELKRCRITDVPSFFFPACVCAVSTPRPLVARVELLVWPRRRTKSAMFC